MAVAKGEKSAAAKPAKAVEKPARASASDELRKARRALTRARGGIKKAAALSPKLTAEQRAEVAAALDEILAAGAEQRKKIAK